MLKNNLDVGAFIVNRVGHPAGRALAKGLWKMDWVRRLASQHPELMRLGSEGLVALTSLLELGGDHPLVRFANFVSETIATENLELLKEFEKNPDDPELAKAVEAKVEAAAKKAEAAEIVIAFDHVHKDAKCVPVAQLLASTATTRTGKDGKTFTTPSPIQLVTTDMASAMAAGKPLCGICYPALAVKKTEEKPKPAEVAPGRNFMEHLMRLRKEEPREYEKFWTAYLERLEGPDGVDLGRKFQEAFNGKHGYEAFRFVVGLPHRNGNGGEEWHVALDALLGRVEPPMSMKGKIGSFLEEEKRQTEEMFRALFDWFAKTASERKRANDARRARIRGLDEAWEAQKRSRKTGKTVRKIVFLGLLVILASWFTIQRVTDAPARSEVSERKEIQHER
jgi:hypothetical protein